MTPNVPFWSSLKRILLL